MPRHAILIPEYIPDDDICIQVSIPNSPDFIQMFYDALSRLSHTRNYARDEYKSGKIIADVWVNRTLSPLLNDLVNQSGCTSVVLNCGDVNDCLETSPIISEINQNLVRYSAPTNVFIDATTHVTPDSANVSNPLGEPVPDTIENPNLCKDSLWAGCYSVSTMLHNQNMDFLERTSAITGNNLRKITGLIDLIPVVGAVVDELVIADLIDFIALMAGDMYTQYESIVTDDLIAETACAYFAMGCSDCSVPTFQQILDYHESFISGLSFDNATTTLIDIISLFVTGSFASNQWYHAMTWFQLWVLLAEETFLQKRGTGWIAFAYKLGSNSPDNDWVLWCDECVEPETYDVTFDFSTGEQGWFRVQPCAGYPSGVYDAGWRVAGNQRRASDCSTRPSWRIVEIVVPIADTTITNLDIDYAGVVLGTGYTALSAFARDNHTGVATGSQGILGVSPSPTGTGTYSWSGSVNITSAYLCVRLWVSELTVGSADGRIMKIRVRGNGSSPF